MRPRLVLSMWWLSGRGREGGGGGCLTAAAVAVVGGGGMEGGALCLRHRMPVSS